ncbi:DUF1488 domain-containing protein [Vibrio sp. JPW-9-11-11]|uniref:DUF1488 domain-containing protein n=1 Tax=Vibrio sp. JPW-9-11-11 TaxID=1416532 RepID=UPI001593390B|nr:DUF1488 domain-containing protein [Vibrio sp. JPW-9-11-11]NVD05895.1 DUF1488 domain-containing protein [Vibrio sp. JPW-9-11-11]
MNQSILFPDIQAWQAESQVISFPAQQSGALIECIVSKRALEKLSGQTVSDEQQALAVFAQYRFDLEELAEGLIEDEEYNSLGQIEVMA